MHLAEAFSRTGTLNLILAAFGFVAQTFLFFKPPRYMTLFRLFILSVILSNLLYMSGVFYFWESWRAPFHAAIYVLATREAAGYLGWGQPKSREIFRLRNFAEGVGLLWAGVYAVMSKTADVDSATAFFCTGFLIVHLIDIEESTWLLTTAFGNHASLLFLWFLSSCLATIFYDGWFTPNAWKLGIHAAISAVWPIVAVRLPQVGRHPDLGVSRALRPFR